MCESERETEIYESKKEVHLEAHEECNETKHPAEDEEDNNRHHYVVWRFNFNKNPTPCHWTCLDHLYVCIYII